MTLNSWFTIEPEDYIVAGTYRIKSIWLGFSGYLPPDVIKGIFHITQTQGRVVRIQSSQDWMTFIDSCYSLRCKNVGES
jgi:hypothetical protein